MTGPQRQNRRKRRLTDAQVAEIARRFGAGERPRLVALIYGVSETTVRKIGSGRMYSRITGIEEDFEADPEYNAGKDEEDGK